MEHKLIDIGVNLMHRSYSGDREAVLSAAQAGGVSPLIITGTYLRSSEASARYAARFPGQLYSTAGVHPHDAKGCDERTIPGLRRLLRQPQVVAVGECGLDYDRNFSPPDVQRKWFEEQILLAEEAGLPLFLHERSAHRDFLAILSRHGGAAKRSVVHCFTGTAYEAMRYLDIGCMIGVTGWICDERRSQSLRDAVRVIPPERLMVETDAPFLTPRDLAEKPRGGRNEPKYLPHILRQIAALMGQDPAELAAVTLENTVRFFGLDADAGKDRIDG